LKLRARHKQSLKSETFYCTVMLISRTVGWTESYKLVYNSTQENGIHSRMQCHM